MSKPRRARRIVLGLVGLILVFGGAIFLDAWVSAGRTIERETESVRKRSEEFRNLRINFPNLFEPAEEGNAVESFEASEKELEAIEPYDALDVLPSLAGDEVPRIDDEAIALMHQRLLPALAQLRRALSRREWEPTRDYDDLTKSRWSIAGVIKWNRILVDLAAHEHRAGDDRAAFELIAMGLGLGSLPCAKGVLLDDLVRFVTNSMQRLGLKVLLADHEAGPADFLWLGRAIDRLDECLPSFVEVLRRDDLYMRQVYLKSYREGSELFDFFGESRGYRKFLPLRMQVAHLLSRQEFVLRCQEKIASAPPWERVELSARLLQSTKSVNITELLAVDSGEVATKSWRNWLMEFQSATQSRLALAVAQYESEHNRYPATLHDLVPGILKVIPVDPLDGRPFRYVNRGNSAEIISFGHDHDDDGGRPVEDDLDDRLDGDLVWTVKRRGAGGK